MTAEANPLAHARRRARWAYEAARVRTASWHAVMLAGLAALAAVLSFGRADVAWVAVAFTAWTAIEWRGGAALRGGRAGAIVGFVALAMPLWAFRACCRAGDMIMGADCCRMSGACAAVGVGLGLTLGVALLRAPRAQRLEHGGGMVAALLAVASVRCGALLAGESLGLLGGLAAGAMASGLVTAFGMRARNRHA